MEALEAAIGCVAPLWCPVEPNGGYIASELKKIHDDSLSVFPESVYSSERRRKGRWKSTMRDDYIPIHARTSGHEEKPPVLDECGVQGSLQAPNNTLFQQWKVPSHVTESRCSSRDSSLSVDKMADQLEEIRLGSPTRPPSGLPSISSVRTGARPETVNSRVMFKTTPRRGTRLRQPKSLAAKTLMAKYRSSDDRNMTQRWLDQASDLDKQKVLNAVNAAGGRAPGHYDVTAPVKKWLKNASSKERDMALQLFQSLAGTQLLNGSSDKQQRVDHVIGLLRGPPDDARQSLPTNKQDRRYVNILTPTTRAERWRHQTWHHLPAYPNTSRVVNRSAILLEPSSTVHQHFTIHPDWGP